MDARISSPVQLHHHVPLRAERLPLGALGQMGRHVLLAVGAGNHADGDVWIQALIPSDSAPYSGGTMAIKAEDIYEDMDRLIETYSMLGNKTRVLRLTPEQWERLSNDCQRALKKKHPEPSGIRWPGRQARLQGIHTHPACGTRRLSLTP